MANSTAPVNAQPNRGHQDSFLQDFDAISPRAYLYTPPTQQLQSQQQKLIILCTWMGASSRHLVKYTEQYIERYPDVPLLLIRSTVRDVFLRSVSSQMDRIGPAATVVKSMQDKANAAGTKLNVLLHIMSNGGCSTACSLNEIYGVLYPSTAKGAGRQANETRLPVTAMIIDSAPSMPDAKLAHNAMMENIRGNVLIRMTAAAIFWFAILVIYVLDKTLRRTGFIQDLRNQLNDPKGPFLSRDIPRTYICGKGDKMVPMPDVVLHASEAVQALGMSDADKHITVEEFVGSGHVMHMPAGPERYWSIMQETWSRATA